MHHFLIYGPGFQTVEDFLVQPQRRFFGLFSLFLFFLSRLFPLQLPDFLQFLQLAKMGPIQLYQFIPVAGFLPQRSELTDEFLHIRHAKLVQNGSDEHLILIGHAVGIRHQDTVQDVVDQLQLHILPLMHVGDIDQARHPSLRQIHFRRSRHQMQQIFRLQGGRKHLIVSHQPFMEIVRQPQHRRIVLQRDRRFYRQHVTTSFPSSVVLFFQRAPSSARCAPAAAHQPAASPALNRYAGFYFLFRNSAIWRAL